MPTRNEIFHHQDLRISDQLVPGQVDLYPDPIGETPSTVSCISPKSEELKERNRDRKINLRSPCPFPPSLLNQHSVKASLLFPFIVAVQLQINPIKPVKEGKRHSFKRLERLFFDSNAFFAEYFGARLNIVSLKRDVMHAWPI